MISARRVCPLADHPGIGRISERFGQRVKLSASRRAGEQLAILAIAAYEDYRGWRGKMTVRYEAGRHNPARWNP